MKKRKPIKEKVPDIKCKKCNLLLGQDHGAGYLIVCPHCKTEAEDEWHYTR